MNSLKSTSLPPLVLASGSAIRKRLLKNAQLPVITLLPNFDEGAKEAFSAEETARFNAEGKAKSVYLRALETYGQEVIVIGSDQVCCLASGEQLHKPGTTENAIKQLSQASGQLLTFTTSLALMVGHQIHVSLTTECRVKLRDLDHSEICEYVAADQPLASAGSFHAEGAGQRLIESIETEDINILYGLPLLALLKALRDLNRVPGYSLPNQS